MKVMRLTANLSRPLSTAAACLLAIALLAGSVCGPACAGALCAAKSQTHTGKTNCHGMGARTDAPFSFAARPQACNLAAATVATLTKPVAETNTSLHSLSSFPFVNTSDDSAIAANKAHNSLFHSQDSPPNLLVSSISLTVLRI